MLLLCRLLMPSIYSFCIDEIRHCQNRQWPHWRKSYETNWSKQVTSRQQRKIVEVPPVLVMRIFRINESKFIDRNFIRNSSWEPFVWTGWDKYEQTSRTCISKHCSSLPKYVGSYLLYIPWISFKRCHWSSTYIFSIGRNNSFRGTKKSWLCVSPFALVEIDSLPKCDNQRAWELLKQDVFELSQRMKRRSMFHSIDCCVSVILLDCDAVL